ncbi:hypothetical protein [Caballeronia catudaia]|uniref:hypothetical protein n=1 Tax=Caballeronia catudaia TaxID=1777136 RepID=UPI00117F9E0B|nr:hypothetical protein [Caballeronia catudaia]
MTYRIYKFNRIKNIDSFRYDPFHIGRADIKDQEDSMTAATFSDRWASLRDMAVSILADFARVA